MLINYFIFSPRLKLSQCLLAGGIQRKKRPSNTELAQRLPTERKNSCQERRRHIFKGFSISLLPKHQVNSDEYQWSFSRNGELDIEKSLRRRIRAESRIDNENELSVRD